MSSPSIKTRAEEVQAILSSPPPAPPMPSPDLPSTPTETQRPGSTRQRLDRYTANVIEDLRAQTDTKIETLTARIVRLEGAVHDLAGITGRTPDMFQNMSELVKDLADQQKEIMGAMKALASAVGQMVSEQNARCGGPPLHTSSSAVHIEDDQSATSSNSTDLSLQSLRLNAEAGPSVPPAHTPPIPGGSGKGKGKKGRKR